jgi:hypothetical protein
VRKRPFCTTSAHIVRCSLGNARINRLRSRSALRDCDRAHELGRQQSEENFSPAKVNVVSCTEIMPCSHHALLSLPKLRDCEMGSSARIRPEVLPVKPNEQKILK